MRQGNLTYGTLDLLFAALYAWFGFRVLPGRSTAYDVALGVLVALLVIGGVGLLVGARWGRAAALVASAALLTFTAVVLVLLVASAAYLRGVYGALGQGMAVVCLIAAALFVELFALLPLFQLRFLLRDRR
jgi:hypothetical protein